MATNLLGSIGFETREARIMQRAFAKIVTKITKSYGGKVTERVVVS